MSVSRSDELPSAAGVMLSIPDGHLLFLRRATGGDHGGEWCWPGGGVDPGETPEAAARREVEEETGHHIDGDLSQSDHSKGEVEFTTFAHRLPARFEPRLNDEHSEYVWAQPGQPPEPLHPGVAATLAKVAHQTAKDCSGQAMDMVLALDRSARTLDQDGHLRVVGNVLSRAEVSPYRGSEIPGYRELGLDPNRVYKLYRDSSELEKGAPTLEGKPVLIKHQPISADDHPADLVAGAVSNPTYKNGEITGDISIWDKDAIAGIDDGSKRHLSCGYHYTPHMMAGRTPDGGAYDGVMKSIKFNHLALVENPRIKGAVVADSADELHWLPLDRVLTELAEWDRLGQALDAITSQKLPNRPSGHQ